jgi:hypothetical protein
MPYSCSLSLQPASNASGILLIPGPNLAAWAPVFTNTTPTNVRFYTDPDAGSLPTRWYGASQFP